MFKSFVRLGREKAVTLLKEQASFFTQMELEKLDKTKVPAHIAIIPDGNRRWAKGYLKEVGEGYKEGAEVLVTTVKAAKELGVRILTVFSFSTENWSRPVHEVNGLLALIGDYLISCRAMMLQLRVRLSVIGDISKLPRYLIDIIEETKQITAHCNEFDLVLAMNYGSRDEIKRAIKKILSEYSENKLSLEDITEEKIHSYLDTRCWPDPDLIIRTSGEERISNFLLWQSSYSEIYIEDVHWPHFTPHHLLKAVLDYQQRERRRGGG